MGGIGEWREGGTDGRTDGRIEGALEGGKEMDSDMKEIVRVWRNRECRIAYLVYCFVVKKKIAWVLRVSGGPG